MTVVILVNMILAFQSNTIKYFTTQQFDSDNLIKFGLLFCTVLSVLVCLTILLYKGEYRIPIRRVGLNTPYHSSSYLPIRVTPAGAMPFMYGMTLMMLPPYIFILLCRQIFANSFAKAILTARNVFSTTLVISAVLISVTTISP